MDDCFDLNSMSTYLETDLSVFFQWIPWVAAGLAKQAAGLEKTEMNHEVVSMGGF